MKLMKRFQQELGEESLGLQAGETMNKKGYDSFGKKAKQKYIFCQFQRFKNPELVLPPVSEVCLKKTYIHLHSDF